MLAQEMFLLLSLLWTPELDSGGFIILLQIDLLDLFDARAIQNLIVVLIGHDMSF